VTAKKPAKKTARKTAPVTCRRIELQFSDGTTSCWIGTNANRIAWWMERQASLELLQVAANGYKVRESDDPLHGAQKRSQSWIDS